MDINTGDGERSLKFRENEMVVRFKYFKHIIFRD